MFTMFDAPILVTTLDETGTFTGRLALEYVYI